MTTTDLASLFSPDFATARSRFRAAAERALAALQSHPFEGTGPNGEPLVMDVATLGPSEADRVVLLTSGLHGVEGYFGSAVQLAWLQSALERPLPPGLRIVLVHTLNPFGFAHIRRFNENNVDLNRNFVIDYGFLGNNPRYEESRRAYERLESFLNPPSPPAFGEPYALTSALVLLKTGWNVRRELPPAQRPSAIAAKRLLNLGLAEIKKTIPVGQYEWPRGLFHGGRSPEATTRLVRSLLPVWVGPARSVVHLDYHTGLGVWGSYKLLIHVPSDHAMYTRAAHLFGADNIEPEDRNETSYSAHGVMAEDLAHRLQDRDYTVVTAEFGTLPPAVVLKALRAENRAHHFARPGSSAFRRAKAGLLEAFCPASPAWRTRVVSAGVRLVDQAIA